MKPMKIEDPSWESTYMNFAKGVASHSKAVKAKVGCVIAKGDKIISLGYNGTPPGWDNTCEDRVCHQHKTYDEATGAEGLRMDCKLVTRPEVVHAEINAIAKVARSNESCEGATLYVTKAPCIECAKAIIMSGISTVFFTGDFDMCDEDGPALMLASGLNVIVLDDHGESYV